jgi:hypothetical protein
MKRHHPHADERVARPQQSPLVGLGADSLFGAPSVPVASSERGADQADVKTQCGLILVELYLAGCVPGSNKYLSRDDLIARIDGLTVNAATGRLAPSGSLIVPKGANPAVGQWPVLAVEDTGRSAIGNVVMGYQLTACGVARTQRGVAAA